MQSTSFVGWPRWNRPWLLAVAAGWLLSGIPNIISGGLTVQAAEALPGPDVDGPQMAEELRGYKPAEDLEVAATLSIREKGKLRRLLPLKIQTIVSTNGWFTRYTLTVSSGPEKGVTEVLEVRRLGDGPPTYARRRAAAPPATGSAAVEPLVEVAAGESSARFGGSDFSLADLGLEFLFWPDQKITGRETRRTRDCYVLESRRKDVPPVGGAYAKVRSWVDLKTRQFVRAEAYDAAGVRVKMFKPDEFVYYKGRWQVKQLAIESPGVGSESYILFNFRDRETGDTLDTKSATAAAAAESAPGR